MTYARARLWLGVSCIGTLVLLAIFGLALGIPSVALDTEETTVFSLLRDVFLFTLFFFLVISPFDLLGGFAFPREFRRYSPKSILWFLVGIIRGAAPQIFVFCISALVLTSSYSALGYAGLALTVFALGALLLLFQPAMSFMVSGIKHSKPENSRENWRYPVLFAESKDSSFTGGITGTIWNPKIVMPRLWFDILSPDEFDVMLARREFAIDSSSRTGGLLVALSYLTCGIVLSFFLTESVCGLSPTNSAGYATAMLWSIIWSFIGLLILPTASSKSSLYVDQCVINEGGSVLHNASNDSKSDPADLVDVAKILNSALIKIEQLSDNEPKRSQWIERIFHPIPSIANRSRGTSEFLLPLSAWQCLRTYLFLSWIVSGLTARAVHCNLGKPDLWVYLPSD